MGNTWEVLAWVEAPNGRMGYVAEYRGESLIAAIVCAIRLKRNGAGCVKIEWR